MASHNILGRDGEKLAKGYLEELGYEILEENWVFKKSEIDLIVYKNSTIIFVEVKTRRNNFFADPEDFVNPDKQKQMVLAADEYVHLMSHQHEIRFDIISVLFDNFGKPVINHIEDAFWP
jgi:putative endonuclease